MHKLCTTGVVAALGLAAALVPSSAASADSTNGAIVTNNGSKPAAEICRIALLGFETVSLNFSQAASPSGQGVLVCHFKDLTPAPSSIESTSGFLCGLYATDSTGRSYLAVTTDSTFEVTPSGNGTLRCYATAADIIF